MGFQPGQSGNPGGRPKEAAGLAKMIREQSKDGAEFVDQLMLLSKHGEPKDRISALKVLLEYGFGKPTQPVEHSADGSLADLFDKIKNPGKPAE